MKKICIPPILIAFIISSCNTPKPEVLTEGQKLTIIEEIKSIQSKTEEAIINKDVDAVFSSMDPDNFLGFINNGRISEDYNSLVSGFRKGYANFDTVKFNSFNKKFTVLSSSLVLSTSSFTEDITTMDGNTMSIKGAVTSLAQKTDDTWHVVHVHQSYFPVEN